MYGDASLLSQPYVLTEITAITPFASLLLITARIDSHAHTKVYRRADARALPESELTVSVSQSATADNPQRCAYKLSRRNRRICATLLLARSPTRITAPMSMTMPDL